MVLQSPVVKKKNYYMKFLQNYLLVPMWSLTLFQSEYIFIYSNKFNVYAYMKGCCSSWPRFLGSIYMIYFPIFLLPNNLHQSISPTTNIIRCTWSWEGSFSHIESTLAAYYIPILMQGIKHVWKVHEQYFYSRRIIHEQLFSFAGLPVVERKHLVRYTY